MKVQTRIFKDKNLLPQLVIDEMNYVFYRYKENIIIHLNFLGLDLGGLQCADEIHVIDWVAFGRAQPLQDFIFNLLEFLLHFGITHNQLVLSFLQVRPFLRHHSSEKLIFQTARKLNQNLIVLKRYRRGIKLNFFLNFYWVYNFPMQSILAECNQIKQTDEMGYDMQSMIQY